MQCRGWFVGDFFGHCHLDVRGAIKNFSKRELASLFKNPENGRWLTADEAKDALLDHLAAGRVVLPMGPACDGFDYSGGGCPGHAVPVTLATVKPPRDMRVKVPAVAEIREDQ